jgi:hypothetical protein
MREAIREGAITRERGSDERGLRWRKSHERGALARMEGQSPKRSSDERGQRCGRASDTRGAIMEGQP